MKRIFVILTLTLLLTVFSLSVAAYNDISDGDVAEAVSVLDSLGVVNGYSDGGYHPSATLTRAELSKLITVLMGEEDKLSTYSQKTLFTDVTSEHWGAAYVNLVYSKGLLKGYGNGMFGPDDKVTYEQLLTVMLRLLDYTDSDIGTVYPDDYVKTAERLKLADGVDRSMGKEITRGDTAILLVNLISSKTKSGVKYYKRLADSVIEAAVILSIDTMSDSGVPDCVKLYADGKTLWCKKSADIPKNFTGVSGTVLLDGDDRITAFIPDSDSFSAVSGVLVTNSQHSVDGSLPYETVMWVDGKKAVYPRASVISSELTGHYGTLLLDGNGYATAFISDETDVYTTLKSAVLMRADTVSDIGRENSAEFLVSGKSTYYEKAETSTVYESDTGKSGTLLLDPDGYAVAFFSDEKNAYTIVNGVVAEIDTNKVALYSGGEVKWYGTYAAISQSFVGASGRAVVNSHGEVTAFLPNGDVGSAYEDTILLDDDIKYDGESGYALFLVDGKAEYLERLGIFSEADVYKSGTLLTDGDGRAVAFFSEDSVPYTAEKGILIDWQGSELRLMYDLENGYIKECKTAFTPASSFAGQYGTLLFNEKGKATAFFCLEDDEKYTVTDVGILIDAYVLAQDGYTGTAKFYTGGRMVTYKVSYLLDSDWELCVGRLLVDSYGEATVLIKNDNYYADEGVTSATATFLEGAYNDYDMTPDTPVIIGTEVTTWKNAYSCLEGENITIFFNDLGAIELIYSE